MSFVDELERHLTDGIAVDQRRRAHRRRAAVAVTAAIVAALVATGGWSILNGDRASQVATEVGDTTTPSTTPTTAVDPSTDDSVPVPDPTTTGEPDAAARSFGLSGNVVLPMGSELFVWGGGFDNNEGAEPNNPGIRYDLDTDSWRTLPPAPGGPQNGAAAAWTGTDVIICCGRPSDGGPAAAIAYDPASDSWRELAAPPLSEAAAAVWLNGRLYVVSGFVTAAYDPATDTWDRLASPPPETALSTWSPIVVAGDTIVLWPLKPSRSTSNGYVYDPVTDTWSELPAPPEDFHPAMADVAWTGRELIIIGGLPAPMAGDSERIVGARLDWATRTWRRLPDVWPEPEPTEGNLGSASIVWTGEVAVVAASALGSGVDPIDGAIATYNPATDQWRRLETPGGWAWNPSLIAAGDEVLAITGGRVHRIDATADAGEPVGVSGIPAVLTPPLTDIPIRGVSLTLVGTNGNGGGIVVLDLDHGVRTVYQSGRHHRLGGALTDLAMSDGWLYVWNTDEPTVRFPNEVTSFDLRRLTIGELTQPGDVVRAGGRERTVWPVPGSDLLWEWEMVDDRGLLRVARLVDIGAGPDAQAEDEVPFDDDHGPQGVGSDGSLVVGGDESITVVAPDGRQLDAGSGSVLAVAGGEILIQTCDDDRCERRWADVTTGRTVRSADTDTDQRWFTVGEPVIPSHSLPLDPVSPDGSQILVFSRRLDDPSPTDPTIDLLRVDVATLATESVPQPGGPRPGAVATWSRDGRHVVVIERHDVIVADLRTGLVDRHVGVVPDGYFVLAAG